MFSSADFAPNASTFHQIVGMIDQVYKLLHISFFIDTAYCKN